MSRGSSSSGRGERDAGEWVRAQGRATARRAHNKKPRGAGNGAKPPGSMSVSLACGPGRRTVRLSARYPPVRRGQKRRAIDAGRPERVVEPDGASGVRIPIGGGGNGCSTPMVSMCTHARPASRFTYARAAEPGSVLSRGRNVSGVPSPGHRYKPCRVYAFTISEGLGRHTKGEGPELLSLHCVEAGFGLFRFATRPTCLFGVIGNILYRRCPCAADRYVWSGTSTTPSAGSPSRADCRAADVREGRGRGRCLGAARAVLLRHEGPPAARARNAASAGAFGSMAAGGCVPEAATLRSKCCARSCGRSSPSTTGAVTPRRFDVRRARFTRFACSTSRCKATRGGGRHPPRCRGNRFAEQLRSRAATCGILGQGGALLWAA